MAVVLRTLLGNVLRLLLAVAGALAVVYGAGTSGCVVRGPSRPPPADPRAAVPGAPPGTLVEEPEPVEEPLDSAELVATLTESLAAARSPGDVALLRLERGLAFLELDRLGEAEADLRVALREPSTRPLATALSAAVALKRGGYDERPAASTSRRAAWGRWRTAAGGPRWAGWP